MSALYLLPLDARTRLIASGEYTEETAPTEAALQFVLDLLALRLESWLGYQAYRHRVEEILIVNRRYRLVLSEYPVLDVHRVESIYGKVVATPSVATFYSVSTGIWPGQRGVDVPFPPGTECRVCYEAGYDPLPPEFGLAMFLLLRRALQTSGISGDLAFLDEPTRDMSSLSLPGGVSKSFQLGKAATGKGGASTQLDRLLSGILSKYQRSLYL